MNTSRKIRLALGIILFISGFVSCKVQEESIKTNHNKMENNGLVIKESNQSFEATYSKLRRTIDTNPNLKIILELDHSKNASSVGLTLNPTKIILFGNPNLGTVLMNDQQTTSIDLPQKIVVFQEGNGTVKIAYNDPAYLKNRHDLSEQTQEVLNKVSGALDKITSAALNE